MNASRLGIGRWPVATALCVVAVFLATGCDRPPKESPAGAEPPPAPSNRIDVPPPVRTNLGITFAPVEYRDVARTLRLPGRFELRPSARREQRAPVAGRIQLLAQQYRPVKAGEVLYRIDSSAWRDLSERISALEAQVGSMTPLRDAHRVHEEALAEKVQLWTDRLAALETLRAAGGADATRVMEASATLIATRADLAEIMEKDAELEARQRSIEAELRALVARREYLRRVAGATAAESAENADPNVLEVRASVDGIVESIALAEGGLAEESALVLTLVQPHALHFRAQGLQADLGRMRDGLRARIVAASADANLPPIPGALRLAPTADAERRTIDLLLEPAASRAAWARSKASGAWCAAPAGPNATSTRSR